MNAASNSNKPNIETFFPVLFVFGPTFIVTGLVFEWQDHARAARGMPSDGLLWPTLAIIGTVMLLIGVTAIIAKKCQNSIVLNTTEEGTMDTQNNERVIGMLEDALEKARQGTSRSAFLLTIKPNGVDQTGEFASEEDIRAAIDACDAVKASLSDLIAKVEGQKTAGQEQPKV